MRYWSYSKLTDDPLMNSVNIYKLVEIIAKIILYFRLINLDIDQYELLIFVVILKNVTKNHDQLTATASG